MFTWMVSSLLGFATFNYFIVANFILVSACTDFERQIKVGH